MALFEVRGLTKAFGRHVVLNGLDLDIFTGEVVTIIGESGSGKSILLKAMMGLLEVDAGSIRFDGEEVTGQTEREWTQTRRRIGMLFQESALFDSLNVFDNVAYALHEQTTMTDEEIATRSQKRSRWSVFRVSRRCRRRISREACASAWRWPARWPFAPRSSSTTSPPKG